MCIGKAALNKEEIKLLQTKGTAAGKFAIDCNKTLLEYNIWRSSEHIIDLPDPVAAAIALWDDVVLGCVGLLLHLHQRGPRLRSGDPLQPKARNATEEPYVNIPPNARVVKSIDYIMLRSRR